MSKKEIMDYSSLHPERKKRVVKRTTSANQVSLPEGARKDRVRVGRGRSSGQGKTCGRGQKGQGARTGYSKRAGFEGGQMPLHRRLPKRGFTNIFKVPYQGVNLWRIAKSNLSGEITPEVMMKAGLISDARKPVKILGAGEVKGALKIVADAFSQSAKERVEAGGGSCSVRGA